MHDHDFDLIAEHASGFLTGADAARADELIASCGVCAEEFETHSQIRTLLATAPLPVMSEFERSRLRRTVLDEVSPPRPVVRPWQQRFLAVAGGIAAVAVAIVGFGVLGQSADEGGDMTVAGESATTAQADALVPMGDADDGSMGIMSDEEAAASDEVFDMAETESAARFAGQLVDTVGDTVDLDAILSELTVAAAEIGEPVPLDELVAFGATCAPSLESPILGAVLTVIDGEHVQVFVVGDPAEPTVEYITTSDCAPIAP